MWRSLPQQALLYKHKQACKAAAKFPKLSIADKPADPSSLDLRKLNTHLLSVMVSHSSARGLLRNL